MATTSRPPSAKPAQALRSKQNEAARQAVYIATPTLDGSLDARYVSALLQSADALRAQRIHYEIGFELGNSLIADARNQLASRFLRSGCTDLVFIDSDLAWQPADLLRLLAWPVPLVAGVYQRKSAKLDFAVKFGPRIVPRGELITAERVGTGFLRLRRDCLEKLAHAHPEWKLIDPKDPGNHRLHALFDTSIEDGQFIGEDFTFCNRWRAIGGEVLVDPKIRLAHYGLHAYDEPLTNHLKPNTSQSSGTSSGRSSA